jgi:phosphatidylserine synthase 2
VLLQHLDPSLGVAVTYRDYGSACAIWHPTTGTLDWSNVLSALDVFVLAHSVGWWGKALLIRNTTLLWAYSIGFELMEATFAVSYLTEVWAWQCGENAGCSSTRGLVTSRLYGC